MFVKFNQKKDRYEVDDREVSPASALSTRWLLHALYKSQSYANGRLLDVGCSAKPYESFFGVSNHLGIDWPNSQHQFKADAFADAQEIPFADKTFDTVLCTEVIEHLSKPSQAIREMVRVLRPGGYLIVSAPFVHVLHELPYDYFRYTFIGLQALMSNAGLQPVNYWTRGGMLTVIIDLWSRFFLVWCRRLVFRHMPFRKHLEPLVLTLFVIWPQRLFAWIAIGIDKLSAKWKWLRVFNTSMHLTLGYVIVAQRS